jgi:hypothetical protein
LVQTSCDRCLSATPRSWRREEVFGHVGFRPCAATNGHEDHDDAVAQGGESVLVLRGGGGAGSSPASVTSASVGAEAMPLTGDYIVIAVLIVLILWAVAMYFL